MTKWQVNESVLKVTISMVNRILQVEAFNILFLPSFAMKVNNFFVSSNSSVIRQKGESQNGCSKKAKHSQISEKHTRFEIRPFALLLTNVP